MEAFPRPRPRAFDQQRATLIERTGFGRLDPILLVAGIALIAFSIYTLGVATQHDVPGNPYYYVVRQSIYAVVGIALMLGVARIDYSRFRELRVGIYSAMIGLIILVLMLGEATRGSRRWIDLPFFTFQPSELGKVLLVVTLAAFVIDRSRRLSDRAADAPDPRSGALPGGARLPPAGPRNSACLCGDHARRAVRGRACAGPTSRRWRGSPARRSQSCW